ncbi:hypothetical protein OMAG_000580 [Candidatus Omnitrophus magneticus]|uniref:Uncharacterized protein n=1 Tax=Candidatus Omnitrophus magneticus TaxID=1609969 RepID=A0A0F0CQJ4_9BACT|nr:hypothetical protein OMAG_000580 [Candidatus Omnitrophus magneticus]
MLSQVGNFQLKFLGIFTLKLTMRVSCFKNSKNGCGADLLPITQ